MEDFTSNLVDSSPFIRDAHDQGDILKSTKTKTEIRSLSFTAGSTTTGSPIVSAGGRVINRSTANRPVRRRFSEYLQRSPRSSTHEDIMEDMSEIGDSPPLLCSSRLNDSEFESLDASQLRTTLEEVCQENSELKLELQQKDRQILKAKSQVKALLDLENASGTKASFYNSVFSQHSNQTQFENSSYPCATTDGREMEVIGKDSVSRESPDREVAEGVQILPESTFVFIREITSRIEVDQVRSRMIEGLHITNQLALGGAAGWIGAYLLKNFGKTALTALGGGGLMVAYATRKGYVDVNWSGIYEELQRTTEEQINESLVREDGYVIDDPDEASEVRIQNAKKWVQTHSVTVGGFVGGFLYNLL